MNLQPKIHAPEGTRQPHPPVVQASVPTLTSTPAPARTPDGRAVMYGPDAGPSEAPSHATRRAKRPHEDMAPTQEAPVPEPDRKARTEARSEAPGAPPLPNRQHTPRTPGERAIEAVFAHSPYATPRLDLLPRVVREAVRAALLASPDPALLEPAGRTLAAHLGKQTDMDIVRGALFRELHLALATVRDTAQPDTDRASPDSVRREAASLLRGFARERLPLAQDRQRLYGQFFGYALQRMAHRVVNFEEDLQAACEVVGFAAEGEALPAPELLAEMLWQALARLWAPRWERRINHDAQACQRLAGTLAQAGRDAAGTRSALVGVLAQEGTRLDAQALGYLMGGLGETDDAQARQDLRVLLQSPVLSPAQQGAAAWGMACGRTAGPAGLAAPFDGAATCVFLDANGTDMAAVVRQLQAWAAPDGDDLQVRLMRGLIEARREAADALRMAFRADEARAQRLGHELDRLATAMHTLDKTLTCAVAQEVATCTQPQRFELLARYARAIGVQARRLDKAAIATLMDRQIPAEPAVESKQDASAQRAAREALRADLHAGLHLDPTDPQQLAGFTRLPVTQRISLMEALGVSLSARDRDELAERIAQFSRAAGDPQLRTALLLRLFRNSARVAGGPQLRAVRQALIDDSLRQARLAGGKPGDAKTVCDHLVDLYATWRESQGMSPWLDERRPVPADDRPAVRAFRDALARELTDLQGQPGVWRIAGESLGQGLKADLAQLDAALAEPPPVLVG